VVAPTGTDLTDEVGRSRAEPNIGCTDVTFAGVLARW